MKEAVCVVLPFGDGYLSASRRHDSTKWGFPGGKVDAGETPAEAAVRELEEETGLVLDVDLLSAVFCDVCYGTDCNDFLTTTYVYTGPQMISRLEMLTAEDGLVLKVLSKDELCSPAFSPFSEYNSQVFKSLN